jgi:hypothetical protein
MKVERHDVPVSTIDKFADENDLVMEVFERGKGTEPNHRYFAHFKDAEVMDRGFLRSTFGDGPDPDAAIAAYAMEISETRLVIGAHREGRRELAVPHLVSQQAFERHAQGSQS